ncbi:MAG: DUF815 domain-containing protein, partial [Alphaproteobacteria bacterium]|nr:DUF815 domain-containing protein [Alphaproteobacteria bacterium]
MSNDKVLNLFGRLVEAIERLAPPPPADIDLTSADAFVWEADRRELRRVVKVAAVSLDLLVGIDRVRDILESNTERFAAGKPANNALLWGA